MNYLLRRGETTSMLRKTRSMIALEFAWYLLRSREQGKEVVAWVLARAACEGVACFTDVPDLGITTSALGMTSDSKVRDVYLHEAFTPKFGTRSVAFRNRCKTRTRRVTGD